MAKTFDEIDDSLRAFIGAQRMFFVATAPLVASGHVNVSPKGLDTLRILGRIGPSAISTGEECDKSRRPSSGDVDRGAGAFGFLTRPRGLRNDFFQSA